MDNESENVKAWLNDRDDDEWYGFYSPTDIIDKILNEENFIENPENQDTEPDIITPGKDTEEDLLYDFWIRFLSLFGFINPDWSQIPKKVVRWYTGLFIEPNNIFFIQPDNGVETAKYVRTINPDEKNLVSVNGENMIKFLRSF